MQKRSNNSSTHDLLPNPHKTISLEREERMLLLKAMRNPSNAENILF
jgi:hypothetical protein